MKLDKELLDIQWLKPALTNGWLGKHLDDLRGRHSVPDEGVNRDFRALLADKEYVSAAQSLIEQCERQCDEPGPFEIAMAEGNTHLVVALLAQTNLAAYGFENNLLAMAVAYNRRAIFNLLLLHPDIQIQCSYEVDREAREVAEFCGIWDWCAHYCPHMWLMEAQYEPLYPVLNIDWQFPIDGNTGSPLLVHLYREGNFGAMNRLVAIGADINPPLDEGDQSERLIHLALENWKDNKPETQLGLKWFARYMSFLNDASFDADVLTDLLSIENPQIVELFKLNAIAYIEDDMAEKRELFSDSEDDSAEFKRVLYMPLPYSPRHQHQACSLADDLLRLRLVELVAEVEDLQFSITDTGIKFDIYYQHNSSPQSVLLPTRVLEILKFSSPLPIAAMTSFQCQMWLLTCPTELYLWLNVLAKDAGKPIFSMIKGHPICDIERQLKLSDILATGGIEAEPALIDHLVNELVRFESVLRFLSDEGLLQKPFMKDEEDNLKEWRAQGLQKQPKLALEIVEQNDSAQLLVRAMIEDKWHDLGARPIEADWAAMLFEAPIFIPCHQCGELSYRHSLAYEQECLVCINSLQELEEV
jgi:hypothetical protein